MTLTEQLTDYIHAAFSGLWVQTSEPDEAEREILRHARERDWKVAVWDVANGLRLPTPRPARRPTRRPATRWPPSAPCPPWPTATARPCCFCTTSTGSSTTRRWCKPRSPSWSPASSSGPSWWCCRPVVQIPVELEKLFVVLEHALPDRDQLERIARELTSDSPDDLPQGDDLQRVLDAAAGLTRYEAEGAFALSLDPPQRPPAGGRLGAEGADAQEEQPADAAPRRRTLRLAGRPGQPQGFLPPGPAAGPARAAAGRPAFGRPRSRKELFSRRRWATRRAGPRWCSTSARCTAPWSGRRRPTSARPCKVADAMSPCVLPATRWRRPLAASAAGRQRRRPPGCSARC